VDALCPATKEFTVALFIRIALVRDEFSYNVLIL